MSKQPFQQRFGVANGKLISDDFPASARTALIYLLVDLDEKFYLVSSEQVYLELNRLGRITNKTFKGESPEGFMNQVSYRINELQWYLVYSFCERIYDKLLSSCGNTYDESYKSLETAREYYAEELNQLLDEENLAYIFEKGRFERRGRPQTQKNLERVGAVLSDDRLEKTRKLFNKARDFFNKRPESDNSNCVKESLCALEACIEALSKQPVKDFEKTIRQLEGNGTGKIPAPIAEGILKLYGYRGSGQGVAHAASQGYPVTKFDAELILSVVAAYITYLHDIFPPIDEFTF